MSWSRDESEIGSQTVEKELARRREEGAPLVPVMPSGKGPKIAQTFWGQAWQRCLEACTAYEHRLPKGRTLLRQGRVYDVTIHSGVIKAIVSDPQAVRDVILRLAPLEDEDLVDLQTKCAQSSGSWLDLLAGNLGDELLKELTHPESVLMPHFSRLRASCTCEDWADICPHSAAVLYALALRFDQDPALFFTLRGVDPAQFLKSDKSSFGEEASSSLDDLASLFGIDLLPSEEGFDTRK